MHTPSKTFFTPQLKTFMIPSDSQIRSTFSHCSPTKTRRSNKKICYVSLRARALTRRYWLARTAIRFLTKFGYLSGHRKASW